MNDIIQSYAIYNPIRDQYLVSADIRNSLDKEKFSIYWMDVYHTTWCACYTNYNDYGDDLEWIVLVILEDYGNPEEITDCVLVKVTLGIDGKIIEFHHDHSISITDTLREHSNVSR